MRLRTIRLLGVGAALLLGSSGIAMSHDVVRGGYHGGYHGATMEDITAGIMVATTWSWKTTAAMATTAAPITARLAATWPERPLAQQPVHWSDLQSQARTVTMVAR